MIATNGGANPLVYVVFLGFIPFTYYLFQRYPPHLAALIATLLGELFLPTETALNLPLLPAIDKSSLPYAAVFIGMASRHPGMLARGRFGTGLELLPILGIFGALGTTLTNTMPVQYGSNRLAGMEVLDWFTASILTLLRSAMPLFLGRILFRTPEQVRDALVAVALAGLAYVPIVIGEVRLSPQFHTWTYGYSAGSFMLSVRYGGFRPMGYMVQGLALSVFLVGAIGGAAALRKARIPLLSSKRIPLAALVSRLTAPLLVVMVLMCKSVAAGVYAIVVWLAIVVLKPLAQARLAFALTVIVVAYPVLRATETVPADEIVAWINDIDPDRANSLAARFENEEAMLEHTQGKMLFGWGGYGRNWVPDPETGDWLTVPDGQWILMIGAFGIVGFAATFLIFPIAAFLALRQIPKIPDPRARQLLSGFALILAVRAFDLIPNAMFSLYPLLVAGILQGASTSAAFRNGLGASSAPRLTRRGAVRR